MNTQSIILLSAVLVLFSWAIYRILRPGRKRGGCDSCGGCPIANCDRRK